MKAHQLMDFQVEVYCQIPGPISIGLSGDITNSGDPKAVEIILQNLVDVCVGRQYLESFVNRVVHKSIR